MNVSVELLLPNLGQTHYSSLSVLYLVNHKLILFCTVHPPEKSHHKAKVKHKYIMNINEYRTLPTQSLLEKNQSFSVHCPFNPFAGKPHLYLYAAQESWDVDGVCIDSTLHQKNLHAQLALLLLSFFFLFSFSVQLTWCDCAVMKYFNRLKRV